VVSSLESSLESSLADIVVSSLEDEVEFSFLAQPKTKMDINRK